MLARSGGVDLIVVDSVAALVPRAEIEGEMGDAHGASSAFDVSGASQADFGSSEDRLHDPLYQSNSSEDRCGVRKSRGHNRRQRSEVLCVHAFGSSAIGAIKKGDAVVGNRARIKVVKNKLALRFETLR